jgi:hypothetical protein
MAAEIPIPENRALGVGFLAELGARQVYFGQAEGGEVLEYPGRLYRSREPEDEAQGREGRGISRGLEAEYEAGVVELADDGLAERAVDDTCCESVARALLQHLLDMHPAAVAPGNRGADFGLLENDNVHTLIENSPVVRRSAE